MPKWISTVVYHLSFKKILGSKDYWVFAVRKSGKPDSQATMIGLRDLRKTLLKDSYAVKDRKAPGHIVGLKFRGRVWL